MRFLFSLAGASSLRHLPAKEQYHTAGVAPPPLSSASASSTAVEPSLHDILQVTMNPPLHQLQAARFVRDGGSSNSPSLSTHGPSRRVGRHSGSS